MSAVVYAGDCRILMGGMDEASIDSIVTDPPYELTSARPGGRSPATQGKVMKGFMGMEWDGSGVAFQAETSGAALRVLKPGGWLVAFSGSRTYHRMACAIEDAGFEIRDQIMWIYGSGFPKGGSRGGKGTCLKPAHEPIVLARKPMVGSVAVNEARYGTGAINIDACRVPTDDSLCAGAGGIPLRHDPQVPRGRSGEATADARYQHRGGTDFAATPGPRGGDAKGRWPANIVHDGSDIVVSNFPVTSSGTGAVKRSSASDESGNRGAAYGAESRRAGTVMISHGDAGSAARFFYCAKATKTDRDEGLEQFEPQAFVQFQTGNGESGAASSLSEGRDTQYRNTHPTVKPTALMRWLVRLVTPIGGTVLDPFTGSGSTGKAAVLEARAFVGCELTADYLPIARARIAAAQAAVAEEVARPAPQPDLFATEAA
jgi:DNA modification methylase